MPDDNTIRSISISVTADTKSAATKLTNLAETLDKIKKMTFPSKGLTQFVNAIERMASLNLRGLPSKVDKIADAMKKIESSVSDPKRMNAAVKSMNTYLRAQELLMSKKKLETHIKEAAAKAEERAADRAARAQREAIANQQKEEKMKMTAARVAAYEKNVETAAAREARIAAENAAKQSGKTPEPVGQVVGEVSRDRIVGFEKLGSVLETVGTKMKELGFSAAALEATLKKLANTVVGALGTGLKTIGRLLGKMAIATFASLGSRIKDITKRLGGFFAALKRIAVYRAIRAVLKEITQAFKEGIENLYQYSKAIDGTFAKSMDMLATSALYAKNSLAAMASPIINVLAPAVDMITDKFVGFLNVINETIAAMTGADTWTKAIKYPTEYAEAADDANGSAKKLRATLLGFDEINRLDDNRKGSRGKSGEQLDYSKMFETKTVKTKTKSFIAAIKDAFQKGDLSSIGATIGEKLKNALDNIPWEGIKGSLQRNAKSLATLLNGFIGTPELSKSIGRTIAEAFNSALIKINTFFSTVEWNKLGQFIGSGLSEALRTFDVKKLGETIALTINSGVSLIHGFIQSVHWDELGRFFSDGINGFFNSINTKNLGETISKGLKGALTAVTEFLKTTDFAMIGKKIGELLNSLDWPNILSGLTTALFEALKAVVKALGGLILESPLVGLAIATHIANSIATAFGLPTITSLISQGLVKLIGASTTEALASHELKNVILGGGAGGANLGASGVGHNLGGTTLGGGAGSTAAAASGGLAGTILGVLGAVVGGLAIGSYIGREGSTVGNALDNFLGTSKQGVDLKTAEHDDYWLNHTGDEEYWANRAAKAAKNAAEREAAQKAIDNTNLYSLSDDKLRELLTDSEWKYYWEEVFKLGIDNSLTYAELKSMKKTADSQKTYLQDMKDYWERRGITIDINLKSVGSNGSSATSTMMKNAAIQKVHTKMAGGGEPQTGTVFLAGERGAEIISSKGGHTQVANRDQISQSVASGMEQATAESNAYLREQNMLLRQLVAKDTNFVVPITTGQVTNALDRQNRREGRAVVTVGG